MIYLVIKIVLLISLCFIGCKKNVDLADKPESAIICVQNADSLEAVNKCYTNNTLKAAQNLISKKLITEEQVFSILKFTDKNDVWINVEEKVNNNLAAISIIFSKHSRENMRAFQLNLQAEHVNGLWKLDMTDDFRINDDESIKKYLLNRFKNY